jgi:hypothetical protein
LILALIFGPLGVRGSTRSAVERQTLRGRNKPGMI